MGYSLHKKEQILQKTGGKCILCGQKVILNKTSNIEHYIPQAIYKWVKHQNLKQQLESLENLFIVHKRCNIKKDSRLPTQKNISVLRVHHNIKEQLRILYKTVQESVNVYTSIKQSTWEIQKRLCYFCDKPITIHQATLRRRDNAQTRRKENAICVCSKCNIQAKSSKDKANMIKSKTQRRAEYGENL